MGMNYVHSIISDEEAREHYEKNPTQCGSRRRIGGAGTGVPAAHAQEAPTLDRPLAATLSAPAPAADESRAVGGTTSVSLGEGGATVFTRDTVDQRAVYAQALNGVIAWRKDALADANIKLPYNGTYLTVPEYLQEIGMTESEYLTRSGRMRLS